MPALPDVQAFPTTWNQLHDPRPDQRQDTNFKHNCGPESVAECIMYLTNIELPAGYIADVILGPDQVDVDTYNTQLAAFLHRWSHIDVDDSNHGDAAAGVKYAIGQGYPIIVLFYWDLAAVDRGDLANAGGHWCPVISYDDSSVTRSNPWGGITEMWTWDQFSRYQKSNVYVILKRRRAIDQGDRGLPDEFEQTVLQAAQEAKQRGYGGFSQPAP
ncbi:MAG: hypothetical protein U0822_09415 [Anaerolineae bacterium]